MEQDLNHAKIALRDEDGFIRVQPEPYGSEEDPGTLPTYEAFLPGGIVFRPKDPENGVGCYILVHRHGVEGRVQVGHDPRWMSALPDFGDGGAALYGTTTLSGGKVAPYVGIFGEGGAATEGTVRISVPTSAGTTTIEVNPSTGDVTITHPGGTSITLKGSEILLGGPGALALAKAQNLNIWAAAVVSAITSLGGTCPPLADPSCTVVKGL